uniref:Butyrophilin subfamily 1 member A1-like isoform X2 n=1 Tax=Geotrypetes seraphini TaxID=260995 RepID=A0A6P8PEI0_GEOSA|nr:butyrophilin subfamily 1 member A1-like isoform X2 [Geotrypetes seraphini]XP_033779530.1 butyrophilin subfamily 1 member A1-like isoform X2 [Geotrypetes seraphini]
MGFPKSPWRMSLSSLPRFILLWISHHFQTGNAEDFKVIGPDQPVVAILGEDAVLPCRLIPALNAEDMQMRWFQTNFNFIVHRYENGMDQSEHQNPKYRGRTKLIRNDISCGSVSLRIRNIGLDDEGIYTCYFQLDAYYEDAKVELKVAGLGSAPSISVIDHQDRGIMILFESSGWYPEPEVTWRQEDGERLIPAPETETQKQNGLIKVKTSLLITNQYGKISCDIRNIILNQGRGSMISIADTFYRQVSRWMVSLILILLSMLISCGLLVVLVVYHLKKKRQKEEIYFADVENLSADVAKLSADNAKLSADNATLSADIQFLHAELEWRRRCSFAVDVTLDPETAHPKLILSEDWKSFRWGYTSQTLPESPKRFEISCCVLGCQGFTSGRHYWEVQVGDGSGCAMGVCKDSVKRKEGIKKQSPEGGFWTVENRFGKYSALTFPKTPISLTERTRAVGIFLDYEAGEVSFYDADNKSHLFTFTDTFTGILRPFFSVYFQTLTIRPVATWE